MAADDSARPKSAVTLTVSDVHDIADRLAERANSIENVGTADLVRDLRLTVRVLRALTRSFNSTDVVTLNGA